MADDRFAKGLKLAKGLSACLILAYFISTFAALYFFDALGFQRLGSFWVALLILVFGMSRLVSGQIRDAFEGRGEAQEQFEKKVGPVLFSKEKGWRNFISEDGVEYEKPLVTREEALREYSDFASRASFYLVSNELLVAFFATLQWGYGDKFHCLVNGNGWTTC